ncbi:MAG: OmpA family protein, partial [Bacteroidota bacterium]|nr:OmpA family protein [Bacteroidota bacterium]
TLMVKVPFESNSSAITPGSLTVIDEYIVLLKENEFFDVEIGGHSSAPGDFYANQVLSEKRAKLVYEYLIAEGIEPERLTYRGYGESQLLDIRNTQEAHDKNRRIEFNVIGLNLEVQFAKNSSRLPQSAESQLLFVREMLAANPTYSITIVGHTDISGDADVNQRLSRERAYAVYEYLQRTGASTDQLFYKGMGADQPRYSNDTELGRSKNRRIEIILN